MPEFDSCPKFSELALIPAVSKHRGRFDTIHLIAAPYTAGPYAEGDYDIALPVTGRLVAALKPEYRDVVRRSAAIIRHRRGLPGERAAATARRPTDRLPRPRPARAIRSRR